MCMTNRLLSSLYKSALFLLIVSMINPALAETLITKTSPTTLYQVSTVNALIAGLYEGDIDVKTLVSHGDFGLGSVKGMDGELIAIDGKFYRIAPDGKMNLIADHETTPYAVVAFFHPVTSFST